MVRLRRPLALAASVLVIVTGAALAGYSLNGTLRHAAVPGTGATPGTADADSANLGALANHDTQWMQRALAAADHLDWIDDETRSTAAWFLADVSSENDAPDEEAEPAQGTYAPGT